MFDMRIKNEANIEIAELYFYGDIVGSESDKWSYDDTCPTEIRDFLKSHENKNLEIRINSCGGNCFGGIAISNMIKAHKGKTVCYIDGLAASIATVIASACDEVHLSKNSFFMIHNSWLFAQGNKNDLRETINVLEKMDSAILESYAKHLKEGVSLDTIKELMEKETWLCGGEVLDYFNFIIDEEEIIQAYAKVNKDFNYKNIPSDLLNEISFEEDEEDEICEECGKKPCECDGKEEEQEEKPPIEEEVENEVEPKEEDEEEKIEEEVVEEEKIEEEEVVEEEKIEEIENNAEEDTKDGVCEECGCEPCICEEIKRKEQKEKLLAKAQEITKYLQALEYLKNLNKDE